MLRQVFQSSNFATVLMSIAIGGGVGLGAYTFLYAKGFAYLTNNSAACANCHVMNEQYDGWVKSSHRSAAGCNDCHTPHSFVPKYLTKARNGFWHSFRFTTGRFHEPIQINDRNRNVTEGACRSCHAEIVQAIEGDDHSMGKISCISCHSNVGHL
jgi:cytochrome c nitrite reductase small subunit